MKFKLISLIIGVLMLNLTSFAGTPQTQQGSKAMFFGFNGLSELSVNNSYLGGQYLFADRMGIWAKIGFGFQTSKENETAKDVKNNTVAFDIGLMYYAFQKGPVAMFLSPGFGYSTETAEDENTKYKKTSNIFDGGVEIGVEWWAFENVSFGACTYLCFESTQTTTETNGVETEATETNFGILGSKTGSLWVTFYF